MQENPDDPGNLAYAPKFKKLFRFWDVTTPYFKSTLEHLVCRRELYLSSRIDFNDPFDVRPLLKCDWTVEHIRAHGQNIVSNPMVVASSTLAWKMSSVSGQAKLSLQSIREIKTQFPSHMSKLLDQMGICCFTEELQNPIFWAHYAGSYTGICAEFRSTDNLSHPFCNIMRVPYTPHRPTILASQTGALQTVNGGSKDWDYIAQYGICTKSIDWAVEKEAMVAGIPRWAISTDSSAVPEANFSRSTDQCRN